MLVHCRLHALVLGATLLHADWVDKGWTRMLLVCIVLFDSHRSFDNLRLGLDRII